MSDSWSVAGRDLGLGGGVLVGVLNVTPDSFSDGGEYLDPAAAVSHGLAMVAAGAEIVDVGGESTRPGAGPVDVDEELGRVLPVVSELASADVTVSIDTHKPEVAAEALRTGAVIVNDVTGFTDRGMVEVAAESDCGVVVMHGREEPLDRMAQTVDAVAVVSDFLEARAEKMVEAGVASDRIAIDPGVGFAKRPEQSLALLSGLDRLVSLGRPLMIGSSRKGFLDRAIGKRGWESRDNATAATTALGYLMGARLFRVHDVAKSRDALSIAAAIVAPH